MIVLLPACQSSSSAKSQLQASHTKQFIQKYMMNENGTFATYLQEASSVNPDIVAGRESLSESLGLWLQYSLLVQDQQLFDKGYRMLQEKFLTPQHYIVWKLDRDGTQQVHTNALGDDLRIVSALLMAEKQWGGEYEQTAVNIMKTLRKTEKHHYLVDFYDFENDHAADDLSLVYIDVSALRQLEEIGMLTQAEVERYTSLLNYTAQDDVFYPKLYRVTTGQFAYDEQVNMIDQLIVALHRQENEQSSDGLVTFLKQQFAQTGKLNGSYNRVTKHADMRYESSAVYALAIMLAVDMKDLKWARSLYERMSMLRDQDPNYPGGYVFHQNTHLFDNLFPLIAEASLRKSV